MVRKKSEMPSDKEILDTKIWTLAHHLDDKEIKPNVFFTLLGERLRATDIVLSMGTSPYQVEVRLGVLQDSTMEEKSGEGDVRSGGRAGQPGADTPPAGPDAADSSGSA